MKIKMQSFNGTGKVFSFTVSQYFKSRTNILTFVILIIMALVSVPMFLMFSGAESNKSETDISGIDKIYVLNDTKYSEILSEDLSSNEIYKNVSLVDAGFDETDYDKNIGVNDIFLHVYYEAEANSFYVKSYVLESSELEDGDIKEASSLIAAFLDNARYKEAGIDEQTISSFTNYEVNSGYASDYNSETRDFGSVFAIQYVYSILVLILCVMSATYIIRAVIEEKASKLVDLLMISVKPLALIFGKILGVMTCVFGMIISIAAGFTASYFITGLFMDTSAVKETLESPELKEILSGIGPDTVVIALVSLALGYLTFSILSGISGAAASSMEDVESSNLSVMLFILAGYIVSCFTCALEGQAVSVITSLIPVVSVFCAPVRYVLGDISIWLLLLSWLIQAVTVLILANFCSRVYSSLILYKGNKLKVRQIFSFAKKAEKSVSSR